MSVVDLVVILAAVAYAFGGFRNGAVVGLFSLVGFFLGAALGAQLARPLSRLLASGHAQIPVAVASVLLAALLGQVGGLVIANRLRRRITWRAGRTLDSGIGAALGVVSVLLVSWMLAVPLASSPNPSLSSAVRRSTIVRAVDDVMPGNVRNVYSSLRKYLDRSGFPPVFGDLQSTRIVDVGPPDTALIATAAVQKAQRSTFKILGESSACDRGVEGSGFVYAPHRVLTNAHVVAGTDKLVVDAGGRLLPARVVVFDPRRDVAVLDVPALTAPALAFTRTPAQTGDDAVVLGFPQAGPFDARPARIRALERIIGRDIYGHNRVVREIYSIRSSVRSGNSGGPLIAADATVLGMVFATALDSADTGFVLSRTEIIADADAGRTATAAVATGKCD